MIRTPVCRIILWMLTIACAVGILSLSLQPRPQSAELSSGVTQTFLEWFKAYRDLPEAEKVMVLNRIGNVVREFAHIAEYALLGLLTSLLVYSYRGRRFVGVTFGSVAIFAIADECVQHFFADGRAFQWIDLAKDWLGCLLGIGVIWTVWRLKKRKSYT